MLKVRSDYLVQTGSKVIGVLARESFPYGWDTGSVRDAVEHYLANYSVDVLQVGNEQDQDSASSWYLEPEDWVTLCQNVYSALYPDYVDVPLIGGGLVSGNASYVAGLDLEILSGLAIHPYGRIPNDFTRYDWGIGTLSQLLDLYPSDMQYWITEFGCSDKETGRRVQAVYTRAIAAEITRLSGSYNIPVATLFCLDDCMVNGFGLYHYGAPKLASIYYRSFMSRYN